MYGSSEVNTPISFYNTTIKSITLTTNNVAYGGIIQINGLPTILIFQNCTLGLAKVIF
jgi:hypothetical protein